MLSEKAMADSISQFLFIFRRRNSDGFFKGAREVMYRRITEHIRNGGNGMLTRDEQFFCLGDFQALIIFYRTLPDALGKKLAELRFSDEEFCANVGKAQGRVEIFGKICDDKLDR